MDGSVLLRSEIHIPLHPGHLCTLLWSTMRICWHLIETSWDVPRKPSVNVHSYDLRTILGQLWKIFGNFWKMLESYGKSLNSSSSSCVLHIIKKKNCMVTWRCEFFFIMNLNLQILQNENNFLLFIFPLPF